MTANIHTSNVQAEPIEASGARRGPDWVAVAAAVFMIGVLVRAMFFTPRELRQGDAYKIIYIHLPAAWTAFLAFFLVAIAGGLYLWLRDERFDRFAASSAEAGLVFTTVVLVTGPIWAKPIWGTWWTWDARLTSTLFLWFIYLGYLVLRGAIGDRRMRARYAAILGILGSLLIPFIHMSVYLFRTLHPLPVLASPEAIAGLASGDPARRTMTPEMLTTVLLAVAAFTLLYIAFVRVRYRLALEQDTYDARLIA